MRAAALTAFLLLACPALAGNLGLFEKQTDVGSVTPPGTATYDAATQTYTITSAGANLWGKEDAFHFLWTKMSGDFVLTADIT